MIRILIFFGWVIFFAGALTVFATVRNVVGLEAFGWRADIPAGAAIVAMLVAVALVALSISVVKDIAMAPKASRARREIEKREKGLAAITRGLEAIALGDGPAAKREAAIAIRNLKDAPVAKLIAAQAAHLSGDDMAAGEALAGLLEAPETEFLALRGLYARALRTGDRGAAEGFAARASALRPKARWAFDALVALRLERADYAGAREAILTGERVKTIERAIADRGLAAAFAASAYTSEMDGDADRALIDAQAALKRAPGLAPAAVIVARLLASADRKKAARRLYEAFAAEPAGSLVESVEDLFAQETNDVRAEALGRLAAKNSDAPEAAFARARAALLRGDAGAARDELGPLVSARASPRYLHAMALAQEALNGPAAARAWLDLAASAPREAMLGAQDFKRITREGWSRLVLEYMETGRLLPAPIDAPPSGIGAADLARLTSPEVPAAATQPTPPPATETEARAASEIENSVSGENPGTDEMVERGADAARSVS
ncbi:MAG: heme biosynthesis HemY N-terminal domain-containing protein [Parvularculaceae bacterium]|nr:hypothetical protein [Parvularculaceae bacterium]